jgi:hypothetical protein
MFHRNTARRKTDGSWQMRMSSPGTMSDGRVYSAAISERSRRPAIIAIRQAQIVVAHDWSALARTVATCNHWKLTIAASDLGSNRTQGSVEETNGWTQNP